MAKSKSMLSKVKATSLTYYNLDKTTVDDFKKLYAYLKKHENKDVGEFAVKRANEMLKEQGRYSDYIRKYKAMEILSTSIKH